MNVGIMMEDGKEKKLHHVTRCSIKVKIIGNEKCWRAKINSRADLMLKFCTIIATIFTGEQCNAYSTII